MMTVFEKVKEYPSFKFTRKIDVKNGDTIEMVFGDEGKKGKIKWEVKDDGVMIVENTTAMTDEYWLDSFKENYVIWTDVEMRSLKGEKDIKYNMAMPSVIKRSGSKGQFMKDVQRISKSQFGKC